MTRGGQGSDSGSVAAVGRPHGSVTVVLLPERLTRHWWERILFNQDVHRIRASLTGRPDILVADVPFRAFEPRRDGPPHAAP